jgi:hypothetical protein
MRSTLRFAVVVVAAVLSFGIETGASAKPNSCHFKRPTPTATDLCGSVPPVVVQSACCCSGPPTGTPVCNGGAAHGTGKTTTTVPLPGATPAPMPAAPQSSASTLDYYFHSDKSDIAKAYTILRLAEALFIYIVVIGVAIVALILAWRQFAFWIKGQEALLVLCQKLAEVEQEAEAEVARIDATPSAPPQGATSVGPPPPQGNPPTAAPRAAKREHFEELLNSIHSLSSRIEATKDGIVVVTPIVGVTILLIDLGFFYLFVRYVWPTL